MWTSVRYLGVVVSSVSLLTAMLEDAPNEMAEVLDAPWQGWFLAESFSSEGSCLLTELGPDYATLFNKIKNDLKTFSEVNRSNVDIPQDVQDEMQMSLPRLVAHRGFRLEEHNVSVGDGWTVAIHRIVSPAQSSTSDGTPKTPVLIPCFLLGSSGFWLTAKRNLSLAYILADGGFDVWLGNYRGNSLYARHNRVNSSESNGESAWAFSVNDHALYDTPAQIDYILAATNQSKLHIVGMSQGSISTIQMFSLRPEYNDKVISFASLAGARTMASVKGLQFIKYVTCLVARYMGPDEIFPWNENYAGLIQGAEKEGFHLVRDLLGITSEYTDLKRFPLLVKFLPGGTSTWVLRYYNELWDAAKMINSNASDVELVRTFDYGPRGNMRRFNSESPVWMDIRRLRVPTKVYFSSGDLYCPPVENWKLVRSLPPNTTEHLFIDDVNYSHYNFAMNDKDPSVFYDVLGFLRKIEARQG